MNVEHLENRTPLATDVAAITLFGNPDAEISGGSSALTRMEDYISVEVGTAELVPGDAVTLWWAVFNNPEFCKGPCDVPDLGKPEVQAALLYADGVVVTEDGKATFLASLTEGEMSGSGLVIRFFGG